MFFLGYKYDSVLKLPENIVLGYQIPVSHFWKSIYKEKPLI